MPTTLPLALRPGSCTYQVPFFPPGKAVSARVLGALDHVMEHRCHRPYWLGLCVATGVHGNWRLQAWCALVTAHQLLPAGLAQRSGS